MKLQLIASCILISSLNIIHVESLPKSLSTSTSPSSLSLSSNHSSKSKTKLLIIEEYEANLKPEISSNDIILGYEIPAGLSIPIRLIIFAYICLAIGYLCDEFFVPSLELIGHRLQWPDDLVAAILIPFGTSGPEIFSSAIGVFFASNEIGTGAIIGSAVFNMLAIPAVCAVVAASIIGKPEALDRKPILRDLLFYVIALICLTQAIRDSRIDL